MDNVKTINEIAFTLLANACNVKEEKLIEAFDYEGEYKLWWKKRKGKKLMHIKEPAEKLMDIQKALLPFLYRLYHRTRYCNSSHFFKHENEKLAHREFLKHNLDHRLHGQIPNHSLLGVGEVHSYSSNAQFMIKMDLKDAYYSIEGSKLESVLYQIFFDEVKAYYEAYKELPNSLSTRKRILRRKFRQNEQEIKTKVLEETGHLLEVHKIAFYLSDEDEEQNNPSGFHTFRTGNLEWWGAVCDILEDLGYRDIISEFRQSFFLGEEESSHIFVSKPSTIYLYPPVPFFPTGRFNELRGIIRKLVKEKVDIEGSVVDEVIKVFVSYVVRLATFQNSLPKGSPTSGFLLAIMINESGLLNRMIKRGEKCSVWVDDFIITTSRKPTVERIEKLKSDIDKAGFKHNPKKVKVYDLRNISGSFLGMKLVQRNLNVKEKEYYENYPKHVPRGYNRAKKNGREWTVNKLALPKKKQKQYRAFLHRVTTKPYTEKEKNRAIGYYGHIMSVYQWPVFYMSASLSKVVDAFRKKFFSGKVKDNAKYRCKKGVKGVAAKEGDMRSEVRISKSGK